MNARKFKIHINKNGRPFGFGVSPNADWKILFVSSAALVLAVCVLGTYFFIRVNEGQLFGQTLIETGEQISVDESLLKKTAEYYRSRAALFENIKASKETVPDPSL